MLRRIIDIETTGTDAANDRIVELACIDLSDDGEIVFEHQTLVNPERAIPPEASAIHHLLDADVARAPLLVDAITPFKGAQSYVAHNCAFERAFLDPLLGNQTWVCTYKCALRVWPDAPGHSNQVLRYWLGLSEPFGRARATIPPHRAHSDALITAAILVELLKCATWEELIRWSTEPALHTRLKFGKHRGMKYADAPLDYLEWMATKSELDGDTKGSAQHWIRLRQETTVTVVAERA